MMELLAPAGNMEKLKTAFYFGADACYLAGKRFGLRAFSGNFDENELKEAVELAHSMDKKIYVTLNIVAHNPDFEGLKEYIEYLDSIHVDAVIVSDIGIMQFVKGVQLFIRGVALLRHRVQLRAHSEGKTYPPTRTKLLDMEQGVFVYAAIIPFVVDKVQGIHCH